MASEPQQNPFSSPESSVEAIPLGPLTPMQRRVLEYYLKHRDQPLLWGPLLRDWLRRWFGTLAAYGLLIWIGYLMIPKLIPSDREIPHFAALGLAAFALGGILRDIAYLRQAVDIWPVLQDVMDWNKVAARLEGK